MSIYRKYAAAYPHLAALAAKSETGDRQAITAIATQAGMLAVPSGVTGSELMSLLSRKNGAEGRAKNTEAQQTASAANGKKGGRPVNPDSKRQKKLAEK